MTGSKLPTGIQGFDELSGGGLPASRMSLVVGGAGSGKTIFALQNAVLGTQAGEKVVFVCFEEERDNLIANAAGFDWSISGALGKSLHIIEAHLTADYYRSGMFDIEGLLAIVEAKVRETGATRVIFDAVDVIISLLDHRVAERREFLRLYDWFRKHNLAGLLTAKMRSASEPDTEAEFDFLQYMADCVIILHHRFIDRTSMRSLRILKYRGTSHVADEFPMVISNHGIAISDVTPQRLEYPVSTERVSTGIDRLDTMLDGGYYRGSSMLISGAPGTAKTTLAGCFIAAACRRKDKSLFISFDESSGQIVRNLKSVGINLAPHVKKGLLKMVSLRSGSVSAEEHYLAMCRLIDEHQPECLVVDPISSLSRAGGQLRAISVVLRFVDYAKSKAITALMTSLLEHELPNQELTRSDISTIADTWMQLSFSIQGGERNRALTIIKSRGMHHSNQVRELILSGDGPTLTDVYTAGGQVLMGAARMEREREERRHELEFRGNIRRRRLEIEEEEARIQRQMSELEASLASKRRERQELQEAEQQRLTASEREHEELLMQRYSDQDTHKIRDTGRRKAGSKRRSKKQN